jgi:4-hydroxy-4-methyl-2-oxoglutarate aldolase
VKHIVVRHIPPAPELALVTSLCEHGVATVHEALGRRGLMRPYMRPLREGQQLAGRAATVLVPPGDNWMIHVALEHCGAGDVLVVATLSECTDGMVGDLLATLMQAKGLAGLALDAGCRDVRQVRAMGFPVWSKAISAQGTVKASPGSVNVPIVCAGVLVTPGDIVVADDDGVVVVPRAEVAAASAHAEARGQREEAARQRMASGGPAVGASPTMLQQLRQLGVEWVDELPR